MYDNSSEKISYVETLKIIKVSQHVGRSDRLRSCASHGVVLWGYGSRQWGVRGKGMEVRDRWWLDWRQGYLNGKDLQNIFIYVCYTQTGESEWIVLQKCQIDSIVHSHEVEKHTLLK